MKNLSLLVWLSQLGISVVVPLASFILLGVWLQNQFNLGVWIIIICSVTGAACAIVGLWNSLKKMERIARDETKNKPPVSFNNHE